jgi:hypothetical protein
MMAEKLTRKWVAHTLTERDIATYITEQLRPELGNDQITHVAEICHSIYLWSTRQIAYLGDFAQAIVDNDLAEAAGRADDTNRQGLWLYPIFFYNVAPGGWQERGTK